MSIRCEYKVLESFEKIFDGLMQKPLKLFLVFVLSLAMASASAWVEGYLQGWLSIKPTIY